MAEKLNLLTGIWQKETKKKNKSPEAQVGKEVDAYLKSIGAYVRTINSGGIQRNGRWTTSGQGSGISDRVGILRGGRFIAVELKATGKKKTVTDEQADFLREVINRGGVGCVADSVEDVKKALTQNEQELLELLKVLTTKKVSPQSLEPLFP